MSMVGDTGSPVAKTDRELASQHHRACDDPVAHHAILLGTTGRPDRYGELFVGTKNHSLPTLRTKFEETRQMSPSTTVAFIWWSSVRFRFCLPGPC